MFLYFLVCDLYTELEHLGCHRSLKKKSIKADNETAQSLPLCQGLLFTLDVEVDKMFAIEHPLIDRLASNK